MCFRLILCHHYKVLKVKTAEYSIPSSRLLWSGGTEVGGIFYQCKNSRRAIWIWVFVFSSKLLRFLSITWALLANLLLMVSKDHLLKICISIFLWQKWRQMFHPWVQPLPLETLGLGFKVEEPLSRGLLSGDQGEFGCLVSWMSLP